MKFFQNLSFDFNPRFTIEDEFVWTMRNVGIDYILLGSDVTYFNAGCGSLGEITADSGGKAEDSF